MNDGKHRNSASLLNFSFDGFLTPFVTLLQGGVSVKTVIDIGSADGQFGLHCLSLKKDLHVLNVEANRLFESSLKEIEDELGVPYKIIALSSHRGMLPMQNGAENLYNYHVDNTHKDYQVDEYMDCTTLDNLLNEFDFPEPYFVKMDVEGHEFHILQGADQTLSKTAAVLMEQHVYGGRSIGDFIDRTNYLATRNFSLFDIKQVHYIKRNLNRSIVNVTLGDDPNPAVLRTFHPVFINDKFDFRKLNDHVESSSERSGENRADQQQMKSRRQSIIKSNREFISHLKNSDH